MKKISKIISFLSFIIGSIGIIWGLLFWFLPGEVGVNLFAYYDWQMPLYFRIFIPSSIFGIILGIIARKLLPEDKKLGIIGIVLSFLSLLIWLVIWFWIVGWSTA